MIGCFCVCTDDSPKWTHNATISLIDSYKDSSNFFESSTMKKVDAWRKVAAKMLNQGYQFSHEACEKKMRNLKYRLGNLQLKIFVFC